MRKVIRKTIRHHENGVNVVGDVNAVVATSGRSSGGGYASDGSDPAVGSGRQRIRVVQRGGRKVAPREDGR